MKIYVFYFAVVGIYFGVLAFAANYLGMDVAEMFRGVAGL